VTGSATSETAAGRFTAGGGPERDFSIVLGGPLYQLLCRMHLSTGALEQVRPRAIALAAIAWVPLLVLSVLDGEAFGGRAAVPFARDIEVHIRFLVALPLLVVAELIVHRRMRLIIQQFLDRRLLTDRTLPAFEAAVVSAYRLRNSVTAEVLLLVFVYVVGVMIWWEHYVALTATATWYAVPGNGIDLTRAGKWYAYVSMPLFQFLLIRWYFRIFVWARFLWHVSRIDLCLLPIHPDRVGGLGFLTAVSYGFAPLAVAHGALLAGMIANRILYAGAALPAFKMEILTFVVVVLAIALGPFLVFMPGLAAVKRTGLREYGTLAERYTRGFDSKWLRGGAPPDEPLIGSADIQSLADLANSFDVIKTMRIVPITREAVVPLVVAVLVPILPLLLTMMSFEDLLKRVFGALF
jgi:hypothetical protein